jgi:predicted HicB family RNase H-like nuclease
MTKDMENKTQLLEHRNKRTQQMLVRLTAEEKETFVLASRIAGIGLSTWIRERLRQSAIKELESNGQQIAFLQAEKGFNK